MQLAPTPRDTVFRDGIAQLYRFRRANSATHPGFPVLLVPSIINRWYVMDLARNVSLVQALVAAGLDVYCLDWGKPNDEDRHFTWDNLFERLARVVRAVKRASEASKVGLLGYCMGATVAGIHTALCPDDIAALVNLAGPFDFQYSGFLGHVADERWFKAEMVASAGNITPHQLQSGFTLLRPTGQIAKWVTFADIAHRKAARDVFFALETWANDGIPFPAAAYATYIRELYQQNSLVKGEHHVLGRRVDLHDITCPVLTIVAERDTICPPASARALNEHCGSNDSSQVVVPGGHVGAVVGSRAVTVLYPAICDWLKRTLGATAETGTPVAA